MQGVLKSFPFSFSPEMPTGEEDKDLVKQQEDNIKKNKNVEFQSLIQKDNIKGVADVAKTEASYSVKEFLSLAALAALSRLLASI